MYFAPEMCEGIEFHSKKCDVWAAGVTLWKMLFDEFPFESANMETLFTLIRTNPPNYPEFIDDDLRALLQGLLQKDPEKRITLNEVWEHPWMKKGGTIKKKLKQRGRLLRL